jgi:beta-glucosidase
MIKLIKTFILLLSVSVAQAQFFINKKVEALLGKMTLQEKIGQMNQLSNPFQPTGPLTGNPDIIKMIQEGRLGAMLNVTGAERTRELQQIAMQSRLKIPLLFGQDVIHGYRTNSFVSQDCRH